MNVLTLINELKKAVDAIKRSQEYQQDSVHDSFHQEDKVEEESK